MKLSASRMGLARHCLYWARYDVQWPKDESSDAAEIGRWYHAVACWMIGVLTGLIKKDEVPKPTEPECLSDASELTPEADALALVESFGGAQVRAEVAYVYSPRGTRHVGFDVGRDYGKIEPNEIPGTADVVILEADRAVVVDWKTGQRVDSARDNAQLALLALMVHEYHGVDEVEVQLRYGDGWLDRYTWDAFSLVDVKDEVDALLSVVDPEPQAGLHCTSRYCPIRTTCPKTVEAVAEVCTDGDATMTIVADVDAITSPAHAGHIWGRAQAAKALLDSVFEAVKSYCDTNGPIPLGDGKELACVDETKESLDAGTIQELYEPVSQWLKPEQFAALISVSVPKGGLEKAIKAGAERGQKGPVWNSALDSLRAAGVVKSKTITRHRVRKVKENAA